jgi:hypothetical protein
MISMTAAAPLEGGIDPTRLSEIFAALPERPFCFGAKIQDRAAWASLAAHPLFAGTVADAEKKLAEPLPPMTLDDYCLLWRTGQRGGPYSRARGNRHGRIALYTLAECIENKGRFIAPLEAAIAEVCTEPTWIYNMHDTADQADWHGRRLSVDLGAVLPANDMGSAMVLLGDRLGRQTRQLIESECRRRILDPYRHAVENGSNGRASGMWWTNADMNWNAFCHAGIVGVAMSVLTDKSERACFVAWADKLTRNYLRGLGPDGYCNEGIGYWSYGFSAYIMMCELLWQASGGELNLFDRPNARAMALYPTRITIQEGLVPAYTDCELHRTPDLRLHTFVNRRYRLGLDQWQTDDMALRTSSLPTTLMYSCPNSATAAPPADRGQDYEIHSYFDHGGVVTCRPVRGSACRMGVSLKGGHNAEAHNHDDLGTFVVALGKQLLILDPGGEVYAFRTFSKDRYQSKLINSYGHPVPLVAGKLQREGSDAAARVIAAEFSDARDRFVLDLASAYAVPELTRLVRSFTYDRTGAGSLTVVDDFAFTSPQTFGIALLTYGQWEQRDASTLAISMGREVVTVSIDAGGAAIRIGSEVIDEQTHSGVKPTRIGIDLAAPALSGQIRLTIRPGK